MDNSLLATLNRSRFLIITLVAVAFYGFYLWFLNIYQSQTHAIALVSAFLFDTLLVLGGGYYLLFLRPQQIKWHKALKATPAMLLLSLLILRQFSGDLAKYGLYFFEAYMILLEIGLVSLIVWGVWQFRRLPPHPDPLWRIQNLMTKVMGNNMITHIFSSELSLMYYSFARAPKIQLKNKQSETLDIRRVFHMAGNDFSPLAIIFLIIVEGIPLHFLLERINWIWAWVAMALNVYAVLWSWGSYQAVKNRPSWLEGGVLHLHVGLAWNAEIPLEGIVAVHTNLPAQLTTNPAIKILSTTGISSPNLWLELATPQRFINQLGLAKSTRVVALEVANPAEVKALLAQGTSSS